MSLFIIGEIGINHNGDLGIAKELIDAAAMLGQMLLSFKNVQLIWFTHKIF